MREPHRFAWMVVALLIAGSVINYMDRAALGVVMPQIKRDLGLNNAQYGQAVNAFLAMYMVFYIVGGRVADRLGCRRTAPISIVFWSLASMAHALVRGLRSLWLCRALLGMGEAVFYPAAMRGAAEWFPPRERAKPVSLLLCGLTVGTLLTPPLVARLTGQYGWRPAFLITGALGLLLVPPWLLLHRRIRAVYGVSDPAPAHKLAIEAELAEPSPPLGAVLTRRKYWCVLAARACTDTAWYFYLFWMPGYFQEARGLDLAAAGALLWIPYFSADLGGLAGGWISSALIRRGFSMDRGRKSVLLPAALLGSLGAASVFAPGAHSALALMSIALFGHLGWSSNIHTVITEITPPRHMAVLYGITGAAGTGLGAVSQLVVGPIVDAHGYVPAFAGAGALYLVAATLLLSAGRIERIR